MRMQGLISVEPQSQGLNYHFTIISLSQIRTIIILARFYEMYVKTMTTLFEGGILRWREYFYLTDLHNQLNSTYSFGYIQPYFFFQNNLIRVLG